MMIAAVQIAGSFIDFQMGFSIANVIDPQTGAQSPLIGQFIYTMALLFMLSVNAHHLLLDGIYYVVNTIQQQMVGINTQHKQKCHRIDKLANQRTLCTGLRINNVCY